MNNINNINNEKNEKKKFEGITKMNKTFSKFNYKEEPKQNTMNKSYNKSLINNKDKNDKDFYENKNNNLNRSISPITHKNNQHVESYNLIEANVNDQRKSNSNLSYFEEFNVMNIILICRKKTMIIVLGLLEKNLKLE